MSSFLEQLDKKYRVAGKKVAYLHNTSVDSGKAAQSNKYYYLYEQSNGTFKIVRGRIDHTEVVEKATPSMYEWDALVRKKTQRSSDAYTDVTHLFQEVATTVKAADPKATLTDIANAQVRKLYETLAAYANKSVQQNYTISSDKVTEAMVNEAQTALDHIARELKIGAKKEAINKHLMSLFMIVPRRMDNVRNHILNVDIKTQKDLDAAQKLIADEQATLDVMAGQVAQIKATKNALSPKDKKAAAKSINVLEAMGLEMVPVTDAKEIAMIKDKMNDLKRNGQQDNSGIFKQAFKVVNKRTQAAFDTHLASAKNKQCELFWHGSRNANYLSIAEKGLLIRPAGAGYNGSAFGDGIYFAQHSGKSLNYSDWRGSYRSYTGGNSGQAFLLLFNVNVGNQKVVSNSGNYNLKDLTKEGYDSTWAKATKTSYIAYDEYIIYRSEQCTIQYLIEIG